MQHEVFFVLYSFTAGAFFESHRPAPYKKVTSFDCWNP
jgi:hypothetical protein